MIDKLSSVLWISNSQKLSVKKMKEEYGLHIIALREKVVVYPSISCTLAGND